MDKDYDFSGWATVNNRRCSDGRTILKDAFVDDNGRTVPLVWNHNHTSPDRVLGHAMLENREEGVYAYCKFNDTENGRTAKQLVEHGDVNALSILANQLKEQGRNVVHGVIREVSLVLAGANPGAFIDSVIVHSDGSTTEDREQGIFYTGELIELAHADQSEDDKEEPEKTAGEDQTDGKKETLRDVINTMTDKQKVAMYALIKEIMDQENSAAEDDDEEEEPEMKHNVFDKETDKGAVLSHSDEEQILTLAKTSSIGTLKTAIEQYVNNNDELAHGFDTSSLNVLFPEFKDVRPGEPEMLTTDQDWINKVLSKVTKSPISRIRTRQADIRKIDELRARGYEKTKEKKEVGNIKLLHRTTDPQTVYVKSKIDRDDIVDITDFDVVNYLYKVDRMNLNEELATAIMLGDGREVGEEGKIGEEHIRPIWTDDDLYTIHTDVDIEGMKTKLQGTETDAYFGEEFIYAEAIIHALLYAREKYKGKGNPDFYVAPHTVNMMLLARDRNGRRIYDNVDQLKAALNVGEIITCEQFEGRTRKVEEGSKTKKLLGLMCNLSDYHLGATKGGEVTHFTDFDIDFNQQKSLLETRVSGANTRCFSAIALELDVTP